MLAHAVDRMSQAVQPLVKETGRAAYPFTIGGTVFLVGFKGRVYVVSSRHALDPENLTPLWIFVRDGSRQRIPLDSVHFAPPNLLPDDFADIALIEVDQAVAKRQYARHATLIDLDRHLLDWSTFRDISDFIVVGFPNELSFVDYDKNLIQNQRASLRGRYAGPAHGPYLHSLRIENPPRLSSLSGFSGGPVLTWVRRIGFKSQLVPCGIAVQGTVQSGLVHFIDIAILVTAIEEWARQ